MKKGRERGRKEKQAFRTLVFRNIITFQIVFNKDDEYILMIQNVNLYKNVLKLKTDHQNMHYLFNVY